MTELKEKLNDELWRLENLYYIKDKKGQAVRFILNDQQREFFHDMHFLNTVLKARQLGMSTFIVLFMFNRVLFTPNLTAGVVDRTMDDAEEKLEKIRFAWEMMQRPEHHLPNLARGVVEANPLLVDNSRGMEWEGNKKVYCGTSLRGGTVQYLHVSELGPISFWTPQKAKEIREGAFNTVAPGQFIFIETTHEGGKSGVSYEIMQEAMKNIGRAALNPQEWRFFFFPWFDDEGYTVDPAGVEIRPHIRDYFEKLSKELGREFTPGQIAWYELKERILREGMLKEFPSTPGEAFNAIIKGAIYAKQLVNLRARGRIRDIEPERNVPFYTFWDIGAAGKGSDWTVVYVVQFVGRDILLLRGKARYGEDAQYWASTIRGWEAEYDARIDTHFLPHDAKQVRNLGGKSNKDLLEEAGLRDIQVVPRTPDIWIGINYLRGLLDRFYINEAGCGQKWTKDDTEFPSPLDALFSYQTHEISTEGVLKEQPIHNWASHPADALRTLAEAYERGMIPRTPKSHSGGGLARSLVKVVKDVGYRGPRHDKAERIRVMR
jgi:hypothetical protein